jgi:BASS family bile acid:Na+ symporter
MLATVLSLFPLWAVLGSAIAYAQPDLVIGYKSLIIPFLVGIMFCMGVTLRPSDFTRALRRPKVIALTVALQFLLMPLAAFVVSKLLGLETDLLVGMVLVGAVSGGTASNVIAYLAKADVALSITMTVTSTLLSILATPYLTLLYVGQTVPVPALSMLLSILKIVFIPVLAGVILNFFFHKFIEKRHNLFALFSVVAIVLVIMIIVGLNHERISTVGMGVLAAIVLHNACGLTGAYVISRLVGFSERECRTVAIEVGMQNSGLAVALAMKYFTPLAALPGALFSIWHNISGSILAGIWSRREP